MLHTFKSKVIASDNTTLVLNRMMAPVDTNYSTFGIFILIALIWAKYMYTLTSQLQLDCLPVGHFKALMVLFAPIMVILSF